MYHDQKYEWFLNIKFIWIQGIEHTFSFRFVRPQGLNNSIMCSNASEENFYFKKLICVLTQKMNLINIIKVDEF